ncbi:PAS domain-containing protein [Candidatus Saccharibacteria bacterium]|nr:PAS domain-containing protein [Candidatus Saccharibacteria bacterium]
MSLFSGKKKPGKTTPAPVAASAGVLAQLALNTIRDGVIIVDPNGVIQFMNPAAVEITGCDKADNAVGLDFLLVMKFETTEGEKIEDSNNLLKNAITTNQAFETRNYVLIAGANEKKTPVAITMTPSGDTRSNRIITFRNIAKELEEEGAQTEFISTASHEMRTPVASIEGYLGLALNPQTATIDARARQYLESAHSASQHLGNLFKDLLDVTKLDDRRVRAHLMPIELSGFVKKFSDEYLSKFREKNINYSFGADNNKKGKFSREKTIEQTVYTFADPDFLGEILSNLIENAIKYTPEGGAVWINVQGDGDRALINVTDTGIGIAAEDLQHIFQKFYRADNSQTRTVGGTGLGLYLVKQRTESMDGRVWAESAFGEGSTFYVSLPRLTADEYEKRQIAFQNQRTVQAFAERPLDANVAYNAGQITQNNFAAPQNNSVAAQTVTPVAQMSAPQPVIQSAPQAQVLPAQGVAPQPMMQQSQVAPTIPVVGQPAMSATQPQTAQPVVLASQVPPAPQIQSAQPAVSTLQASSPYQPATTSSDPAFNPAVLQNGQNIIQ